MYFTDYATGAALRAALCAAVKGGDLAGEAYGLASAHQVLVGGS